MLLRNRLNVGEFVVPIPVGIPIVLRYNAKGFISKISFWTAWNVWDNTHVTKLDFVEDSSKPNGRLNEFEISEIEGLSNLLETNSLFPHTISLTGGTTWVYGVLVHNNELNKDDDEYSAYAGLEGRLPYALCSNFSSYFDDLEDCKFFAFNMASHATTIAGASPIRKWLHIQRFSMLPGFLAPQGDSSAVDKCIESICYPEMGKVLYMAYATFSKTHIEVISTDTEICQVTSPVRTIVNENGAYMSKITVSSGEFLVPLNTAKNLKVNKGVKLILQGSDIQGAMYPNNSKSDMPDFVLCSSCYRKIPIRSLTRCPDPHCRSRKYKAVCHMLKVLNADPISFEDYQTKLSNNYPSNFTMGDVLDIISEGSFSVSLTTVLESVMYDVVMKDSTIVSLFVSSCLNSEESVQHYANNPTYIESDFDFGKHDAGILVDWFKDVENVMDLDSVLSHNKIHLVDSDKCFSAAPILRNTEICVTGDFECGGLTTVRRILGSYCAEVVTSIYANTRYVVVGDKKQSIDSRIISTARKVGIPVVGESTFFHAYGIDEDIARNLL